MTGETSGVTTPWETMRLHQLPAWQPAVTEHTYPFKRSYNDRRIGSCLYATILRKIQKAAAAGHSVTSAFEKSVSAMNLFV